MSHRFQLASFPYPHTVEAQPAVSNPLPEINLPEDMAVIQVTNKTVLSEVPGTCPSFQSEDFEPNRKLPPLPKRVFRVRWNDELGPDDQVDPSSARLNAFLYPIARGIVTGVFYLRFRAARGRSFDKIKVANAILEHYRLEVTKWLGSLPQPATDNQIH